MSWVISMNSFAQDPSWASTEAQQGAAWMPLSEVVQHSRNNVVATCAAQWACPSGCLTDQTELSAVSFRLCSRNYTPKYKTVLMPGDADWPVG